MYGAAGFMFCVIVDSFRTRGNGSGKSAEEEREDWCQVRVGIYIHMCLVVPDHV